jgi:phage-related minor tail protein
MTEENLGEIYVKIRADVTGLEKELTDLRRKIDKESKENQTKLDFKAKFDASIAKLRLSELQAYRQKLQKEFDKR